MTRTVTTLHGRVWVACVAAAIACATFVVLAPVAAATATDTPIANPDTYTCAQPSFVGFEDLADGTLLASSTFTGVWFYSGHFRGGTRTWLVGDFATGLYNGKYPFGSYTSEGTHWAWLGAGQGSGVISFENGPASTVALLVSSSSPITLEAYDDSNTLLESASTATSNAGTGAMDELKITEPTADIAYVVVHDTGNTFLVDSLCTDAPITLPGPDLSITGSDSPDPVVAQNPVTYTFTTTNHGPGAASSVVVTDVLPTSLRFSSSSASQGTCGGDGNSVSCSLGTLGAGASATVSIVAQAVTAGTVTNFATASASVGDPLPSNNAVGVTTHVKPSALACTITGTTGNDLLNGTPGDDVICGLGGNDVINSSGGNDVIVGGSGTDRVSYARESAGVTVDLRSGIAIKAGGATDSLIEIENVTGTPFRDVIDGDIGPNRLDGGDGNDQIAGHQGDDVILGGPGDDTLYGGSGSNTVDGGTGEDVLSYSAATAPVTVDLSRSAGAALLQISDAVSNVEDVTGSKFADTINGDSGPNILNGGPGNDILAGHDGDDTILGGPGNDTLYGGLGTNTIDGGNGVDTVSYLAVSSVDVDLSLGTATATSVSDTLTNVENVTGSLGDDVLIGDANNNVLSGASGADTIAGRGGNDTLIGGNGSDTVDYATAAGPVTVDLSAGTATGDGNDTLDTIENVIGSSFNDTITGDALRNTVHAGDGDDVLNGGGGNDVLYGEAKNDTINGDVGNDTLIGGSGNDNLDGGPGTDVCRQGAGTGTIVNCES